MPRATLAGHLIRRRPEAVSPNNAASLSQIAGSEARYAALGDRNRRLRDEAQGRMALDEARALSHIDRSALAPLGSELARSVPSGLVRGSVRGRDFANRASTRLPNEQGGE